MHATTGQALPPPFSAHTARGVRAARAAARHAPTHRGGQGVQDRHEEGAGPVELRHGHDGAEGQALQQLVHGQRQDQGKQAPAPLHRHLRARARGAAGHGVIREPRNSGCHVGGARARPLVSQARPAGFWSWVLRVLCFGFWIL